MPSPLTLTPLTQVTSVLDGARYLHTLTEPLKPGLAPLLEALGQAAAVTDKAFLTPKHVGIGRF